MANLSPKKYIQTKARSLPIYKCLVNKGWEEARMADVIVMRQHVNGNVTAGIYLVDLLCLGIKDTSFFFNTGEEEVMERFSMFGDMFEEIDYTLAHNIIYAGYDFAMEFNISPHPDFAVTKYILEEDSDKIPLIEVEVGDAQDGKPHLMVRSGGDFTDALQKLKKYAGEGNYYYTVDTGEYSDDEEEDDEEDNISEHLDDYAEGALTAANIQYVAIEDLMNKEKTDKRTLHEQVTIHIELLLRLLYNLHPEYFYEEDIEDQPEYEYIENAEMYPAGGDERMLFEFADAIGKIDTALDKQKEHEDDRTKNDIFLNQLQQYHQNPLLVASLYENGFVEKREPVMQTARQYLEALEPQYPLTTLSLALVALIAKEPEERFQYIYDQPDLQQLYNLSTSWNIPELNTFWLIQMLVHLQKEDLKQAIHYYELVAETGIFNWLILPAQFGLIESIEKVLNLKERFQNLQ